MSVYDTMASDFDRRRALPDGVPEAIRDTILAAIGTARPAILDLGAGAGRIGRSFVRAGDDYIGADLSFGMLLAFAGSVAAPRLVQADGARLPFADATFDAVLLVQVLSGAHRWQHLLTDTMRVLRPGGALIAGRVVAPDDGIDARMKARLATILDDIDVHPYRDKPRDDALSWLIRTMPEHTVRTAATWTAERTPAAFLERHAGGARFSVLDAAVKQDAMRQLAVWATGQFGSLDAAFAENYSFELTIHRSQQGIPT
ncbi:class I SAM-dependent methyltransferase [Acidisphaera sp. S103]|uniref:class I SAM-dependent methyltransferase n=1 Tax=Acidisphaera sp. S103 TaxID=1747223 RepID=UPI00131DDFA9|nr:class I SAM-dependent methyltransferase [Acidisphaera sp. S103]